MQAPFALRKNFVCFAKKICQQEAIPSVNNFIHLPNFWKCHQTSKMLSRSFGGLQCFVRQQNPLLLDSHPLQGHLILRIGQIIVPLLTFLNIKNFCVPQVRTKLQKQNIGDYKIFKFLASAKLYLLSYYEQGLTFHPCNISLGCLWCNLQINKQHPSLESKNLIKHHPKLIRG